MGATIIGGGAIGVGGAFGAEEPELSNTDLTDTVGNTVPSSADDAAAGADTGIAGLGTGAAGGCVGAGAEAGGGSLFALVLVSVGKRLRIIVEIPCGFVSASGGGGGGIGTGGFKAGARVVAGDEGTSGLVVAEVEDEDEDEDEDEELVDLDVDVEFEVELLDGNAVWPVLFCLFTLVQRRHGR